MQPNGNAAAYFVDRLTEAGRGDATAFIDPSRSLTYSGLRAASSRFAIALRDAGIARERRIALVLLDTIDFPIAFWGALRAGVVPVPVNTLLTPEQTGYVLADSRAEALVISAPLLRGLRSVLADLPQLRRIIVAAPNGSTPELIKGETGFADFLAAGQDTMPPAQASPDEVAFWLYSSGSTGQPKGVKHVHSSLLATAETYGAQVLGIRPDDLVFSAAKLFFAYGLGNAMTFPMSVGAAAVLLPDRPTPEVVLATMRTAQPTIFGGVPTLFASLLAHPLIGPGAGSDRLRRCISAGEALPEAVGQRWRETVGTDILDGLGSTEMLHIFLSNRPDDVHYGTSGRPVTGYEVEIVDDAGAPVPDGDSGELLVRGPSAADGYWNQRDKTRRTFQGEWTRTGDTYVRNADGTYRYCGRADDMMKVGGIWVSPFEVEAALISHAAVLEAAVVGHPDELGLIKPRAFVVLHPSAVETPHNALHEQLKAHVQAKVGVWKYPRWIDVVESLPKTATGKIQRYKLRLLAK
ncbi:MAG TPA: benzoate-CoA ligase family protein [Acetobacteraceae bacterium]|nr:benzoate-CoA ligase family protein [Acetobacteraceae bacterium]